MKGDRKGGRKGRCRKCGKWRQRGRGRKRKADELDEKLANARGDRPAQKKARAELAEYLGMSDDNKMSSEEVAARTGQPIWNNGVRVARDPTPHQTHGSQMGLLEARRLLQSTRVDHSSSQKHSSLRKRLHTVIVRYL